MREIQTTQFIDEVQKYIAKKEQPEQILEHIDEVMKELCKKTNVYYNITKPLFSDDYNIFKNLLETICNTHIALCQSTPYYIRIKDKDKSEYSW